MNLTAFSKFISRSLAIFVVLGLGLLSLVSLFALGPISSTEYQAYLEELEGIDNPRSRVAGVSTFANLDFDFLLREENVIYNIEQQSNSAKLDIKMPLEKFSNKESEENIFDQNVPVITLENNNLQARLYKLELSSSIAELNLVDSGNNILLVNESIENKVYSILLQPQEVITLDASLINLGSESLDSVGNQISFQLDLIIDNNLPQSFEQIPAQG